MMRRQLREHLPALASRFGIMPWHIDPEPPMLTVGEAETFTRALYEPPSDPSEGEAD
jgi:hypothetical protein